jgi:hypothetical protein
LRPYSFPLAGKGQDRGNGSDSFASSRVATEPDRGRAVALAEASVLASWRIQVSPAATIRKLPSRFCLLKRTIDSRDRWRPTRGSKSLR